MKNLDKLYQEAIEANIAVHSAMARTNMIQLNLILEQV